MPSVYVLGAGASAGYENGQLGIKPPVACCFFKAVGEVIARSDGLDRQRFAELWAFLKKYFCVSVEDLRACNLDIEEVLTFLDIGKAKLQARRQLLNLIALTLDKIICGQPCQHHGRLVNSLREGDAIITFNWDLIVDNVIACDHESGPNYGVDLLEVIQEARLPVARQRDKPLLLKPHGSMNWMWCRRCRKNFAHILNDRARMRATVSA